MKNTILTISQILFLFLVIVSCSEEDSTRNLKIENPTLSGQTCDNTSIYFTDQVCNDHIQPPNEESLIHSESFDTEWRYNCATDQIEAYGKVYSMTRDDEYNDNNNYVKTQILLSKNDQIFSLGGINHSTQIFTTNGQSNGVAEAVTEKSWFFDSDENLTGVSIVAQTIIWGCYGAPTNEFYTSPSAHTIHIARDEREQFDANQLQIEPDLSAPENLSLTVPASSPLLSWDAVSDTISTYEILRKDRGVMVPLATTTSTSYVDFSVITFNPTQTFTYAVRTIGCSPYSTAYSPLSNIVTVDGHTYN